MKFAQFGFLPQPLKNWADFSNIFVLFFHETRQSVGVNNVYSKITENEVHSSKISSNGG